MAQRIEFQFVGDPSDLVDAFRQVKGAAEDTEKATDGTAGSVGDLNERFTEASGKIGNAATMVAKYTAGLGAAVGAMVLLAAKTAEADRVLGDFAIRMGTDVQTLSELRHAAAAVGLDFEELERGTRKLGQGLAEMAAGGTSETAEAMRRLGLGGTDLLENLDQVADAFADMEEGAEKTTLAMRLFGEESGPRMLEFLNQGSAGIANLREEAARLGATVRDEDVAAAREFRSAMGELQSASSALAAEFGRAMLPTLIEIARATSDAVQGFRDWAGLTRETSTETENLEKRTARYRFRVREAEEAIRGFETAIRALQEAGQPVPEEYGTQLARFRDQLATFTAMLGEAEGTTVELINATDRFADEADQGYGTEIPEAIKKTQDVIELAAKAERLALEEFKNAKDERIEVLQEEADQRAALAREVADEEARQLEKLQGKRDRVAEYNREQQAEARDYSIQIAQEIGDFLIRINEEAQAARQQEVDRVASRINDTERALAEATNERDRDTLRRRLRNLRDQEAEAVKLAREEWRRGQALMVAQAAIGTAASIVQAIGSNPPPYSYILAGISAAMGTANMIAIAAQPQPFHTGGMVRDEVTIRARTGEAVLSPQGVTSIGGADAVAELNRGRGGGPSPVVIVQKLDHKVYNAQTTQALRRQGSALTTAIRAAQPRAIGRNNPYRSS